MAHEPELWASETPWFDAFQSIVTKVQSTDPDAKGTVGEIMEARVRRAFAHLVSASGEPSPADADSGARRAGDAWPVVRDIIRAERAKWDHGNAQSLAGSCVVSALNTVTDKARAALAAGDTTAPPASDPAATPNSSRTSSTLGDGSAPPAGEPTRGDNYGKVTAVDVTAREIVVLGTPADEQGEESGHNCDALGCGSTGPHVLWRGPVVFARPAGPAPADAATLEKIAKAWGVIRELNHGRVRWQLSVPARPDADPDLIISDALLAAECALTSRAAPSTGGPAE